VLDHFATLPEPRRAAERITHPLLTIVGVSEVLREAHPRSFATCRKYMTFHALNPLPPGTSERAVGMTPVKSASSSAFNAQRP